jgi:hypothetical protein
MPKDKQVTVRIEPALRGLIEEVLELHAAKTGVRATRAAVLREAFKRGLLDLKLHLTSLVE